jgi:hypothetical protein
MAQSSLRIARSCEASSMGGDLGRRSPGETGPSYTEQRKIPRYAFIATIELTDDASAARLSGRVTEISRDGCYVDIMNTLPVGTMLKLQVVRDSGTFATKGKTIYVHERIGMGVVFVDPPPGQLKILDVWLAELSGASS